MVLIPPENLKKRMMNNANYNVLCNYCIANLDFHSIGGLTVLEYIIPLLSSYLQEDFLVFWFFPLIALAFLVTVPFIIRYFFRG